MKNEIKDLFTNEGEELGIGAEEIVLAPNEEIYAEAAEIAAASAQDVKYPFVIKYDINWKEFLLDMIDKCGGVVKEEINDTELAVSVNMTQLKFIKALDCVEGVRVESIAESLKSESDSTDFKETSVLTTEAENSIITTEVQMSDVTEASVASTNIATPGCTTESCCCGGSTMETAIPLTVEELTSVHICCPGSEVWYKFDIEKDRDYTIYSSGGTATGGHLDTIGTLYDADGNQLAYCDDHGAGVYFKICEYLYEGYTYYLKVRAYGNKTGNFYIKVTRDVLVESVTISPSSKTLAKNQTVQLSATVLPADAIGRDVRWVSSNENIATVDWETGIVTAVNVGTTTIQAYDWYERAHVAYCTINVSNSPNYGWPVYPKPHIHMRKYWGARDVVAGRLKPRTRAPERIIFHHAAQNFSSTDFIDAIGEIQRIQNLHIDDEEKCDIAYHFVIDPAGGIWEGALIDDYQRGHAEGYFDDIGVVLLGDFEKRVFNLNPNTLNDNQKNAMKELSKWLCYEYDLPIDEPNDISPITTHRKVDSGILATKCPGKNAAPWIEGDLKSTMNDWLKNYYK